MDGEADVLFVDHQPEWFPKYLTNVPESTNVAFLHYTDDVFAFLLVNRRVHTVVIAGRSLVNSDQKCPCAGNTEQLVAQLRNSHINFGGCILIADHMDDRIDRTSLHLLKATAVVEKSDFWATSRDLVARPA
jgi:hypothetical protein